MVAGKDFSDMADRSSPPEDRQREFVRRYVARRIRSRQLRSGDTTTPSPVS